ncbi:hypothetical protein RchiOBHm_Chr6g0259441 [Rosa chinensis]|uniref:Uncharacterized protein n=1 Tax=Rosa chinensis TaxID=74649 RepID=A0A2P6PMU6_ROSCH|nr:hypothetical protein RchiOBHm_Chr6g0259441 [Rosa chinensis]
MPSHSPQNQGHIPMTNNHSVPSHCTINLVDSRMATLSVSHQFSQILTPQSHPHLYHHNILNPSSNYPPRSLPSNHLQNHAPHLLHIPDTSPFLPLPLPCKAPDATPAHPPTSPCSLPTPTPISPSCLGPGQLCEN